MLVGGDHCVANLSDFHSASSSVALLSSFNSETNGHLRKTWITIQQVRLLQYTHDQRTTVFGTPYCFTHAPTGKSAGDLPQKALKKQFTYLPIYVNSCDEDLMSSDSPRSMCVLADPYLKHYQVDSLVRAVRETGIEISMVVVKETTEQEYDPELVARAVNNPIHLDTFKLFRDVFERERWWSFVIAERKLAQEFGLAGIDEQHIHVDDIDVFDDADVHYVTPIQEGVWNRFPEAIVEEVRENSDMAVRYGFGLIKGDILTAPRDGVLSFHEADFQRYRGLGPSQAYLDGQRTMGLTLQRLSDEIDAGEIIAFEQQDVSDCPTLWSAYGTLRAVQRELLATGIENLRDPNFEPTTPDTLGPYNSTTKRREADFAAKVLAKNIRGYLARFRAQ